MDLLQGDWPELQPQGFDRIEENLGVHWRWALGRSQSLDLSKAPGQWTMHYSFRLPQEGAVLKLSYHGQTLVEKTAKKDETISGSLELVVSGADDILAFSCSRSNEGGDRFSPDPRPLSFLITHLSFSANRILSPQRLAEIKEKFGRETPAFFCSLPFQQFYVSEKGYSAPCCESVLMTNADPSQRYPLSSEAEYRAAWNSATQKGLRLDFAEGKVPDLCRRCANLEKWGGNSMRKLLTGESTAAACVEGMKADGSLSETPRILDLRLGNTCNLKCRMCFPGSSIALAPEFAKIFGGDFSEYESDIFQVGAKNFALALAAMPELQEIRVAGGEPFLIPQFLQLMENLVEAGRAAQVGLVISTNLTQLPEKYLQLFPKFREVTIIASVDAMGPVNDYIRFPSKFSAIEKNLNFLYEQMEKVGVTKVRFNTTVQAYNLFHLQTLFYFLRKYSGKFRYFPHLSLLQNPEYLSVRIFPAEERAKAKAAMEKALAEEKKYFDALKKRAMDWDEIESSLTGLIRYLDQPSKPENIGEFLRVHKEMDELRKTRYPGELVNKLKT